MPVSEDHIETLMAVSRAADVHSGEWAQKAEGVENVEVQQTALLFSLAFNSIAQVTLMAAQDLQGKLIVEKVEE